MSNPGSSAPWVRARVTLNGVQRLTYLGRLLKKAHGNYDFTRAEIEADPGGLKALLSRADVATELFDDAGNETTPPEESRPDPPDNASYRLLPVMSKEPV